MKKTFVRLLAVAMCVVMMLTAAPLSGFVGLELPSMFDFKAEAATYSGSCGDNLIWSLDTSTGVLNITGTGAMYKWSSFPSSVPWDTYRSYIKTVNIASGVTTISNESFEFCDNLTSLTIPDSVTTIDDYALADCDSLAIITVDPDNEYYSSDSYGVLFNKNKTEVIRFPICNTRTSYTIPGSVTIIGVAAFYDCDNLTSVTIPDSVITIDDLAFDNCDSLTSVTIPDGVTTIGACAFDNCDNLTSITIPDSVTTIGDWAFETCDSLTDVYYTGTQEQWNNISIGLDNWNLTFATIHYLGQEDVYNLGDETYKFENYIDSDSDGHCFGMSMTSAAYHMGILDIRSIGGNIYDGLYALNASAAVKKPICYYQDIQGKYVKKSMVAGGSAYVSLFNWGNINSDWKEVVNYVKNHEYDGKGTLQICLGKGNYYHAVNFLRYEVVNGQERIYVYDNNFPDQEVYFYKNSAGNILQTPKSTFSGALTCIGLVSVEKYFSVIGDYNSTRYIFADKGAVSIHGAIEYPLMCATDKARVVFEISEGEEKVVIVPLVENAEFEYLNVTYSFDQAEAGQAGEFILAQDEETASDTVELTYIDFPQNIEIKTPSTTTVNYGDTLILHADFGDIVLPEGYSILWTVEGAGFNMAPAADGLTCNMTSVANGNATVKATLVDENGEAVLDAEGNEMSDTQELKSNANFWQKIVSFFKNLFRINRVIDQ